MRGLHFTTGGRYPVLRSLAILCLLCAALAAVLAIVAAVWVVVQLGDRTLGQRLLLAVSVLCGGFLAVIAILALAEIVELFIDMATSLRTIARRQSGTSGPAGLPDESSAETAILRGR